MQRYVYGTWPHVPDAIITPTDTYRIITSQVGSVMLVVDATTGAVAQEVTYDVFGAVLTDTNPGLQPFGFAGGLYDELTGLTQFGTRWLDPQTGRWTQKDPIGFEGGDTNLYAYVWNDPVGYYDPSGLSGAQERLHESAENGFLSYLGFNAFSTGVRNRADGQLKLSSAQTFDEGVRQIG